MRRGPCLGGKRNHGHGDVGIEHRDDGLEQVAALGGAGVDQHRAADPDAGRAQFFDRAGLAFADSRDSVAAAEIEIHVALPAEHADRQRRHLPFADVHPIEGELLQLLVGGELVRGPEDQFLGAEELGGVDRWRTAGCSSA